MSDSQEVKDPTLALILEEITALRGDVSETRSLIEAQVEVLGHYETSLTALEDDVSELRGLIVAISVGVAMPLSEGSQPPFRRESKPFKSNGNGNGHGDSDVT